MSKTLENKTWYLEDINNYNEEFLKELIIDLYHKLEACKCNVEDLITIKKEKSFERIEIHEISYEDGEETGRSTTSIPKHFFHKKNLELLEKIGAEPSKVAYLRK